MLKNAMFDIEQTRCSEPYVFGLYINSIVVIVDVDVDVDVDVLKFFLLNSVDF